MDRDKGMGETAYVIEDAAYAALVPPSTSVNMLKDSVASLTFEQEDVGTE